MYRSIKSRLFILQLALIIPPKQSENQKLTMKTKQTNKQM